MPEWCLGDGRHFAQGLAAQAKANLTECRSLGVREPQAPDQLGPQAAIFGGKVIRCVEATPDPRCR
jgi:hypothetical protein